MVPFSKLLRHDLRRYGIDADMIIPGLYQGSRPPQGDVLRRAGVDLLVLCAEEHQPRSSRFSVVDVAHAPLGDHLDPLTSQEMEIIRLAALTVARELLTPGKVVLVTCSAGINRSGIVSAAAVMLLLKCSPRDAVTIVKDGRPGALRNRSFVDHLRFVW